MNPNPLVTVVTAAYNAEAFIADALRSVSEQSFADFEAIVVDDGSSDATAERVQPFLSDSRFRLIRQGRAGVSAARNAAVREARGKWIAFLDADDMWLPHKLAVQMVAADSVEDSALVFSNGIEFDEAGDRGLFYRERRKLPEGDILPRLLDRNCLWTSSVIIRRRDLIEVGMFDERIQVGEDYLVWVQILARGGRAVGVWEPLVRYRKSANSLTTDKQRAYRDIERVHTRFLELDLKPAQRAAVRRAISRDQAYQLLAAARTSLASRECGVAALLFRAWLRFPSMPRVLFWMPLLLLPGGRRLLARKLARRW